MSETVFVSCSCGQPISLNQEQLVKLSRELEKRKEEKRAWLRKKFDEANPNTTLIGTVRTARRCAGTLVLFIVSLFVLGSTWSKFEEYSWWILAILAGLGLLTVRALCLNTRAYEEREEKFKLFTKEEEANG